MVTDLQRIGDEIFELEAKGVVDGFSHAQLDSDRVDI